MKSKFAAATAGRCQDELYKMAKTMLSLSDTSMKDYIEAEQAAKRLRVGYADYFSRYDALITQVPSYFRAVSLSSVRVKH